MNRQPYIVNGEVIRGAQNRHGTTTTTTMNWYYYFRWTRFLLLLITIFTFIISNQANEPLIRNLMSIIPIKTSYANSSSRRRQVFDKPITNFGLVSLEEKPFDSIVIHGLQSSWSCRYNDVEFGQVCKWIGRNYSHQKPLIWDRDDRVHTAHRLICFLLILSAALEFCFPGAPVHILMFNNNPIATGLSSIIYRPMLIRDLLCTSTYVYPALHEMNRLLPRLHRGSVFESFGNRDLDFSLSVLFLMFGIGGGCNWVASHLTSRRVYGYDSIIGASLAYYKQATTWGVFPAYILRMFGQDVTTHAAYWTHFVLIVLSSTGGTNNDTPWPKIISYLLAGVMGTLFARYHISSDFLWRFFQGFGS